MLGGYNAHALQRGSRAALVQEHEPWVVFGVTLSSTCLSSEKRGVRRWAVRRGHTLCPCARCCADHFSCLMW